MNATILLSTLIGAGGLVGALVAFVKLKPERESIVVHAAEGAVHIQSAVLDDLSDELKRTQAQFAALEVELRKQVSEVVAQLNAVTSERDGLLAENQELRDRVDELEATAAGLAAKVEQLEKNGH